MLRLSGMATVMNAVKTHWPMISNTFSNRYNAKSHTFVGVDISNRTVKLLQLHQENKTFEVKAYSIISMPATAVITKEIKDIVATANAVKKAITQGNITAAYAAVAIDDASVINKLIQMDATLSDYEIEQQIYFEAEKYIPFKLSEVNFDFKIMGPSTNSADWCDVQLTIARSENISAYEQALSQAGLILKIVDLESYALQRVAELMAAHLPNRGINKVIAMVDVGELRTTLTILYNLSQIFNRNEIFGMQQFTNDILSCEEKNLRLFKSALVQHLQRALQFFFSAKPYSEIHTLLLVGNCAIVPNITDYLTEQLNIPTLIANPFIDMSISSHIDSEKFLQVAPVLTISCGLAVRECSL
ncbi:pilus assembly protein PilM [soil metagenome]